MPVSEALMHVLRASGITELNPPQRMAVEKGLLERKNMVVASPTASGKTLIAELAFLNHILNGGKAVYLVPLKALASEKYREFKERYGSVMKIAISVGDMDSPDTWLGTYDLIIASNEKMDSLLRRSVPWAKDVTLVIVDEVHLLNDPSRGPTLEVVLTRLRRECNAQVLALSATIRNAGEIARWLDAQLVQSDYRPVALRRGTIQPEDTGYRITYEDEGERLLPQQRESEGAIAHDTLRQKKQALFFLSTRRNAEAASDRLASYVNPLLSSEEKTELAALARTIEHALPHPTRQCRRLAAAVASGVAFHHAGLVAAQRTAVEDGFRSGRIKMLAATPTLCLDKGSYVWNGIKEVEIHKAHKSTVLALKSNRLYEVPVIRINSMESPEEMITITTACGNRITVTRNHRMLVKEAGIPKEREAGRCTSGDRIATVGKISIKSVHEPTWSDFVKDNKLPFDDTKLSEHIFYLVGTFLGDGYSGAETEGSGIKYKGSPCIVGKDEEIFDAIKSICHSLGIRYTVNVNRYGIPQLIPTKSKWFREFLVRSGIERGIGKYVHFSYLEANEENLAALLRGLFDTDGYVEKRGFVGISNVSFRLIQCIKKALLRFGIVTYIRERKEGVIRIYGREYKTKKSYELSIFQSKSIETFHKKIGFSVKRKRVNLHEIVNRFNENVLRISCGTCNYTINPNMFSPRGMHHKEWGRKRVKIIEYLGEKGKKTSREVGKDLNFVPWKSEKRLNSHFGFIERKRVGNSVLWSLNLIGQWLHRQLREKKNIDWFLTNETCPLCGTTVIKVKRENWRKYDVDGDIFWDIVKTIETARPTSKKVYDVVLADDGSNDHYFVANGFIIHNSFGLNLPAWRVVIRDAKRYGGYGADYIPVLEVHQMFGRAGRPKYDTDGEALLVAKTKQEAIDLRERYIRGEPEPIYSKLSVEPILRMHVLALVASSVSSIEELRSFFSSTFFAFQYGDIDEVMAKVMPILAELEGYGFLARHEARLGGFVPAFEISSSLKATPLGRRVSELYVDPRSAHLLLTAPGKTALEQLLVLNKCLEMQPLLRVKAKDQDDLEEKISASGVSHPDVWDVDYEDFLESFKTALMFSDWVGEAGEDSLLEKYGIAPGELYTKTLSAEWLLYSTKELFVLTGRKELANAANKLRLRIKHGIREELLPLIELRGIGRARARILYANNIRTRADVRRADPEKLAALIGPKLAAQLREQLSEVLDEKMRQVKRGYRDA